MSPLKPFVVEITRTQTFVHFTDVLVFAESASAARALAQPLVDKANGWRSAHLLGDFLTDDGDLSEWVVGNAGPATPEDVDLRSCEPNTINAPAEEDTDDDQA